MHNQTGARRIRSSCPALLCSALIAAFVCFLSPPPVAAADAGATALQQAQRRLRGADEELNRAKEQAAKADKRLKDAQRAQQDAARAAEDAKTRLEQAHADQEGAKSALTVAQGQYDQARAAIEEIYKARQGAPQ